MENADQENETYTEAETEARREAALKRMFAMPHKPHKLKDPTDGKSATKRKGGVPSV